MNLTKHRLHNYRGTISAVTIGIGLVGGLAGCSQVEGLATQGNMNVIYLSTAATDVLIAQDVAIGQAPTCTVDASKLYSCEGLTADGDSILVRVPENDAEPQMTIWVGDVEVFRGPVLTVLDDASQVKQ
jgi:hypothetical protein